MPKCGIGGLSIPRHVTSSTDRVIGALRIVDDPTFSAGVPA